MWPGETFLDSWPERLEGWPGFHFPPLFSDDLFDTWGYSSFHSLLELDSAVFHSDTAKIWEMNTRLWIFLGLCECLLICLIWVAMRIGVEKSLRQLTLRRKKRTQDFSVNDRVSRQSGMIEAKAFSRRWKWRQSDWPAVKLHLLCSCFVFLFFF